MEDNKYYTPDISEFHVGFEYKVQLSTNGEWCKTKLEANWFIEGETLLKLNNNRPIRVKYLDKEDIEELGFTFDNYTYIKDNFRIYINVELEIPRIKITKEDQIIFDGNIKNKSELKKLLQQLSII